MANEYLTDRSIYIKPVTNTITPPINNINTEKYFDKEMIIDSINGFQLCKYVLYMKCDYCKSVIKRLTVRGIQIGNVGTDKHKNEYPFYYCYDCNKSMCIQCFDKVTSCKNIESINLNKPINAKYKCKKHMLAHRNLYASLALACDSCDVSLNRHVNIYSNREQDTDYCISCVDRDPTLISNFDLALWKHIDIDDWCEFGSIMDWIPISRDNDTVKLFNYNKDSKYCGTYAIAARDNNGHYNIARCNI